MAWVFGRVSGRDGIWLGLGLGSCKGWARKDEVGWGCRLTVGGLGWGGIG